MFPRNANIPIGAVRIFVPTPISSYRWVPHVSWLHMGLRFSDRFRESARLSGSVFLRLRGKSLLLPRARAAPRPQNLVQLHLNRTFDQLSPHTPPAIVSRERRAAPA
jgi:hypothetical protein